MYYRLEVSPRSSSVDAKGRSVCRQIREFLSLPVEAVRTREVFSVMAECTPDQARTALEAFANPVIQTGSLESTPLPPDCDWVVVVGFRPGVTDNVGRSAAAALADLLDRPLTRDEKVFTSTEYLIFAPELDRAQVHHIAVGLLANELIETTVVLSAAECREQGIPRNFPVITDTTPPQVRTVCLEVSDDELVQISRKGTLALTLDEMKAIQAHYREKRAERETAGLPPDPTDVELEVLAQTWSEHCKHKIFSALVDYSDTTTGEHRVIDSLFKTFIRASTEAVAEHVNWLQSIFHDNAGVIRFNDHLSLVYKVETHNSPTALDPYGGSITGIVGVNRDPLGTGKGAMLLSNVWGYCFASPYTAEEDVPKGLFHPRRLRDQVHKGVIDGGNQSGIPYSVGWEYFDERFLGKPLVYCGTLGLLPAELHGEPAYEKEILPDDLVVMVGGRIGKDGIHGATFSSEELHSESPVQAVQIGDPITQKRMSDFLLEARDLGLYRFITDNGAGGLSSSLGEMASLCGGCEIDLARAPLKYAGLQPWEILVSEAQERMSLAVPPESIDAFLELAKRREVEATVLGRFTDSGVFEVAYAEGTVARLDLEFMHDGLPQLRIPAVWTPPVHPEPEIPDDLDLGEALVQVLGRLNVCSGEEKARQYDHEVKGLSAIKPYIGVNGNVAGDAAVMLVDSPESTEAVILAGGVAPRYSDIDTYHMMASVIDIAVRRVMAVGGRLGHIAGLDNFCWPDPVLSDKTPDGPYKMAQLVRANQALYDYTVAFGVPCVSGKDSMKNDSTLGGRKISIPPTVLFSTVARMADVSKAVTLDAKRTGDLVYVIGLTRSELGGSEFYAHLNAVGTSVPTVDAGLALAVYDRIGQATDRELCRSLHTPVFGGLAMAFARKAMGGCLGLDIDLDAVPVDDPGMGAAERLFSESNSRFVATVATADREAFEGILDGVPWACVGHVDLDPVLTLRSDGTVVARVPVRALTEAYTRPLRGL